MKTDSLLDKIAAAFFVVSILVVIPIGTLALFLMAAIPSSADPVAEVETLADVGVSIVTGLSQFEMAIVGVVVVWVLALNACSMRVSDADGSCSTPGTTTTTDLTDSSLVTDFDVDQNDERP